MNPPNPCNFRNAKEYNDAVLIFRQVTAPFLTPDQFLAAQRTCVPYVVPQIYFVPFDMTSWHDRPFTYYPGFNGPGSRRPPRPPMQPMFSPRPPHRPR